MLTTNNAIVGDNAVVEAEGDVHFLAGRTGVFKDIDDEFPEASRFFLDSDANAYADNLDADADASATTESIQSNTVTIGNRASVRSVGDAYLLTDPGFSDLTESFFADTIWAAPDTGGQATDSSSGRIDLDGNVEAGIFNQKTIRIGSDSTWTQELDGVQVASSALGSGNVDIVTGDPFTTIGDVETFDLGASIEARINRLVEDSRAVQGTALEDTYLDEVAFWVDLANTLGGSGTVTASRDGYTVGNIEVTSRSIGDVQAQGGNVFIEGDALFGSGSLTARGDTQIRIENLSDVTLILNQLEVPPGREGEVRFNGSLITDNESIINDETLIGTKDLTLVSGANSADPLIEVTNVVSAGQSTVANLIFNGEVNNRNGDVLLDSGAGSLQVNAQLNAGNLEILSGSDFVLSNDDADGDGFFHVGSDPIDLYESLATFNQNQGDNDTPRGSNGALAGTGSTIAAGNVLINAQHINVNGKIQSGVVEHTIRIKDGNALDAAIRAAEGGTEPVLLSGDYFEVISDTAQTVFLFWDPVNDRLELQGEIQVRGGNMLLIASDVINTGGGELQVLDGYGTIEVINESDYALVLGNLSVGAGVEESEGIEGRITIVETANRLRPGNARGQEVLRTVYTRTRDANGDLVLTSLNNETVDADGNPTNLVTYASTTDATYSPEAGSRFEWNTVQVSGEDVIYELNNQDNKIFNRQTIRDSDNDPVRIFLDESEFRVRGATVDVDATDTNVYSYDRDIRTNIDDSFLLIQPFRVVELITNRLISETFDHELTDTERTTTTHTHSVRADYDIAITFVGDEGEIDVDSNGSVFLGGQLSAPGGTVAITVRDPNSSDSFAPTIESLSVDGVIEAAVIELVSPGGIGGTSTVNTEMTDVDGAGLIVTATGDVDLTQLDGDLVLNDLNVTNGDVMIRSEAGSILAKTVANTVAHIEATDVSLTAAGAIGTADQSINLDTSGAVGAEGGLDVYLRETAGDLDVVTIQGLTITLDVPDGSVRDAIEDVARRDTAAIAALTAQFEEDGLIGDGALAAQAEVVQLAEDAGTADYVQYWSQRNSLLIPSDPSTFDFAFTVEQRAGQLAAGKTESQIDDLEQEVNDRFFALDAIYGAGGTYQTVNAVDNNVSYDPDTFDPNFIYRLGDTERAELISGFNWEIDELLWGLSASIVKPTADTTLIVEQPNLIANVITVTVSGTFGQDVENTEMIFVPGGDISRITDDANNTVKTSLLAAESDDVAIFFWTDTNGNGQVDDGEAMAWEDIDDGDQFVEPGEFNLVELSRREDVDVAGLSGNRPIVNINAGERIFVGAEQDIGLGQLIAEDADGNREDVRVKVDGAIINELVVAGTNVIADDLVLEGAEGDIGTEDVPITIDLSTTGGLTVRGLDDVYVEDVSGTLNLVTGFAGGFFQLTSIDGAILDANDLLRSNGTVQTAVNNVIADEIRFIADTVGTQDNPVEVRLSSDGSFGGSIETSLYVASLSTIRVDELTTDTGNLSVIAEDDLLLGTIQGFNGSVDLESKNGSILDDFPNGRNLLVGSATLSIRGGSETIGLPTERIEVYEATQLDVIGPNSDIEQFSYFTLASLPVGYFELGGSTEASSSGGEAHDFNGDRFPDLLSGANVLLNDGQANFRLVQTGISGVILTVTAADLDDRNSDDLLVYNPTTDRIEVYLNNGQAQFSLAQSIDPGFDVGSVEANIGMVIGNLNGDSAPDFMIVDPINRQFLVYHNTGSATFQLAGAFSFPEGVGGIPPIRLADFTGDGFDDLIVGPTGQFDRVRIYPNLGDPSNFAAFSETRAAFVFDNGTSGPSSGDFITTQFNFWGYDVGDIDGDGDLDLLASASESNRTYIFLNQGVTTVQTEGRLGFNIPDDPRGETRLLFTTDNENVQFETVSSRGQNTTQRSYGVRLGDFDFDGDNDAFLPKGSNGQVWLNDGTGQFIDTFQRLSSGRVFVATLADFNDDLAIDIHVPAGTFLQFTNPEFVDDQTFEVTENRPLDDLVVFAQAILNSPSDTVTFNIDAAYADNGDGTTEVEVTDQFRIDEFGQILVNVDNPSALYYETYRRLRFEVSLSNSRGLSDSTTIIGTIRNLDGVNNSDTSLYAAFGDDLDSITLTEGLPGGTLIADLSRLASDPEPLDRITGYEISGGSQGWEDFTIDSSGQLFYSGASPLDFDSLPDDQKQIVLNIRAFDTEGLSQGPGTVIVKVENVEEAPFFTRSLTAAIGEQPEAGAPIPIVCSGALVTDLGAVDPEGLGISYSLGGGTTLLFVIDPDTGLLSVRDPDAFDFETNSSLTAQIVATDPGGLSTTFDLVVTILDYTQAPIVADQTFDVTEDIDTTIDLAAVDADVALGDVLTYSLVEVFVDQVDPFPDFTAFLGNQPFSVDPLTGAFSFDGDGSLTDDEVVEGYVVTVGVTDLEGRTATSTLTIDLLDGSDPERPSVSDLFLSVPENVLAGTVIGQVNIDPDSVPIVNFRFSEGGRFIGDMISIDPDGVVRVNDESLFDFELDDFHEGIFIADAANGRTATFFVSLSLIDLNEAPILDVENFTSVLVPEDTVAGTVLTTQPPLTAIDPEVAMGDRLSYAFLYPDGTVSQVGPEGFLEIDPETGFITLIDDSNLDFEQFVDPSFTDYVQVQISDTEGLAAIGSPFTLTITNVDEAPVLTDGQSFSVREDAGSGTILGIVDADQREVADGEVFTLIDNPDDIFAIDPDTGELSIADGSPLDFETTASYTLQVRLGNVDEADVRQVTVDVTDVDEHDVAVVKTTTSRGTVSQGDSVTYEIVVSNPGEEDESVVNVEDLLIGLSGVTLDLVGTTGGASTSAVPGAITGAFQDTANIPVGGTVTYTLTGIVAAPTGTTPRASAQLLGGPATVSVPTPEVFDDNNASSPAPILVRASAIDPTYELVVDDSVALSDARALALGDLNGDGDLDAIAFTAPSGGVNVTTFINTNGTFAASTQPIVGLSAFDPSDVALGDLDGDGDLDAVVAMAPTLDAPNGSSFFLLNDGAGGFSLGGTFADGLGLGEVALADFDSDGDLDAAFTGVDATGAVLLATATWVGDGFEVESSTTADPVADQHLALGDLNADGIVDLVRTFQQDDAPAQVEVALGDGSGGFTSTLQGLEITDAVIGDIALGDLDNDGSIDIYVAVKATTDGSLAYDRAFLNDGTGTFSLVDATFGDSAGVEVALDDLDGDGSLDVILATEGGLDAWINDGFGAFSQGQVSGDGQALLGLVAGDLDNDGDTDALTFDSAGIDVVVQISPPAISLPDEVPTLAEDSTLAITGVSVLDPLGGSVTVTVSVDDGEVQLVDGSVTRTGSSVTITGLEDDVNAALATLNYTPSSDASGTFTLTLNASNSETNANATLAIEVEAVDDAPVVSVPSGQSTLEDTSIAIAGVGISDIDSDDLMVTLSTGDGTLSVSGQDAAFVTLSGTPAAINLELASLTFTPALHFNGTATIEVEAVDGENSVVRSFTVEVTPVNDAPTLIVSSPLTTIENTNLPITGLDVEDVDFDIQTVRLEASEGVLTLGTETSATLELSGVASALDLDLANLIFTPRPDFVGAATIDLTVSDGVLSTTGQVVIQVEADQSSDTNQAPQLLVTQLVDRLDEDTDTSSRIAIAEVTVFDDQEGTNVVSLIGQDADLFELDGTTLYLLGGTVLDTETQDSLEVTVQVDDEAVGFEPDDSTTLGITVANVNEAPSATDASFNVIEGAPAGTVLGTVTSTDPDVGDMVNYAIDGDGTFAIDPSTGVITVANPDALDFENGPQSYALTVTVTDLGELVDQANISINLIDVNEAPTVALANAIITLDESTSTLNPIKIADIVLTDDALGDETLSLDGTDADLFSIIGLELFLNAGVSLDADNAPQLDVTVQVDDPSVGESPDSSVSLTVTIEAGAEAPILADQSFTVAENSAAGTVVGMIAVQDGFNGAVTFQVTGGTGQALFSVNSTDGTITVADGATIDREAVASYTLEVTADDQGSPPQTASAVMTLRISDVNDNAPVITSSDLVDVSEGQSDVLELTATDADATAQDPTFAIIGGADAGQFEIVNGNQLRFRATADFESRGDSDGDNTYEVEVEVSDGGDSPDMQSIRVTVTNVDPSVPVDIDTSDNVVDAGVANGTPVGITAESADPLGPDVTWALRDDAGGRYAIDPSTGVVRVADATLLVPSSTDTIVVEASDGVGGVATATFSIAVVGAANDLDLTPEQLAELLDQPNGPDQLANATSIIIDFTTETLDITAELQQALADNANIVVLGLRGQPTDGEDFIVGTSGNDTINAQGGDDTVFGGPGDDRLIGDQTSGNAGGADKLFGGSGNDTIDGGDGNDSILGDLGDDSIKGQNGADTIDGGAGDDTISGDGDQDSILGGDGHDVLGGGGNADVIEGGEGNDTLRGRNGRDTLSGQGGVDVIEGGNGDDLLDGGGNADLIEGGNGDDTLRGRTGRDTLSGGVGFDLIEGGNGDDVIEGGAGNDTLVGGDGDDQLFGDGGVDLLVGEAGMDTLFGGTGRNYLFASDDVTLAIALDRIANGLGDEDDDEDEELIG